MSEAEKYNYKTHNASAERLGASPWTFSQRVKLFVWEYVWMIFCAWTPKPLNFWRLFILRLFGAKIEGTAFVHQRARIQIPWNIILKNKTCIGDRANLYSLAEIEIGERSIIAQEAYLCTGSHDFTHPNRPLKTAPIKIGDNVFIGARAFVMPGIIVGDNSIIGACAFVHKSVEPDTTILR